MHHDLFYKLRDIENRVSNSDNNTNPVVSQKQITKTILLLRKLNSDISKSINNDREIGRKSLLLSVNELFLIYNRYNDAVRRKGKTLESEGFDQHDEIYDNIKQIWYCIDEGIETLLHTLYLYFPDEASKNINLYEKSTNRIQHPLYDKLKKKKEDQKKDQPPNLLPFDDLFIYPELIQKCIDTLKIVDPPILSKSENFIGKEKSAFCVWIDECQRNGLVHNDFNRNQIANAISNKFHPFKMSGSLFDKDNLRAIYKYQQEFKVLLSQVSLERKK